MFEKSKALTLYIFFQITYIVLKLNKALKYFAGSKL